MKRLWSWMMTPVGLTVSIALLGASFIAVQLFVPQWKAPLVPTPYEWRMAAPK